jgi:hypothetical protein
MASGVIKKKNPEILLGYLMSGNLRVNSLFSNFYFFNSFQFKKLDLSNGLVF